MSGAPKLRPSLRPYGRKVILQQVYRRKEPPRSTTTKYLCTVARGEAVPPEARRKAEEKLKKVIPDAMIDWSAVESALSSMRPAPARGEDAGHLADVRESIEKIADHMADDLAGLRSTLRALLGPRKGSRRAPA